MNIVYEANPSQEDITLLGQGISQHAFLKKGQKPIESFAFFIRDDLGQLVAGCNGSMYYGCLYIDQLWVEDCLRGQGLGSQLIEACERLGYEKNCRFSSVNTMDWEALHFYQKLGYRIEFQRDGYEHNSTLYFLIKTITSNTSNPNQS